jgi:hypothetical protein
MLHGGFGSIEDFASQTPELAKHFKLVAFDGPATDALPIMANPSHSTR